MPIRVSVSPSRYYLAPIVVLVLVNASSLSEVFRQMKLEWGASLIPEHSNCVQWPRIRMGLEKHPYH